MLSLDSLFRNTGLRVLSGHFGTNVHAGQVVKASNEHNRCKYCYINVSDLDQR